MIPEIGHFALVLALTLALVQSVLPIWGAARNDAIWMKSALWSSLGQVVFTTIAFGALMISFVRSDFTVVNVVENSNSLKPLLFKVSGTWGSHEGSLLLWVLILTVFGALVATTFPSWSCKAQCDRTRTGNCQCPEGTICSCGESIYKTCSTQQVHHARSWPCRHTC